MATKTPVSMLDEEERRARIPMSVDIRLRELERKWRGAADRLRRARQSDR